jgi:hypothetical protein
MSKLLWSLFLICVLFSLTLAQGDDGGGGGDDGTPTQTPDIVYFSPTPGHDDDNLFTDFEGYVTCKRIAGCPRTDFLSIHVQNTAKDIDTRTKFVTIDTYLQDGTHFSQAPLNQTLAINKVSNLPMKTLRDLKLDETVYFSGKIEWHDVSLSTTTTITFSYYAADSDPATRELLTYPIHFYKHIDQKDEVFDSLETKRTEAPWDYDFNLYVRTPPTLTDEFTLRPYGGIFKNDVTCQIDNLNVDVKAVFDEKDVLSKFPSYKLTIPQNHQLQYQSFKADTQVQIACKGFVHNTGTINRGIVILTHAVKTKIIQIATIERFAKSLSSQTPTMRVADATMDLSISNYISYTSKSIDSHGNAKTFSYHTVLAELSAAELSLPSNKTMHLYLDGIEGGAIILARWSLSVRDSTGAFLPYTTTDKLSVAWYADGKVARFDTWVLSMTNDMRRRYDSTKPARLTISYVLTFDTAVRLPPVLTPTAMIAVEQEVHWVNFASSRQIVTFYQFATPVLSRKAMVATENFQLQAFHFEHDEHKDDDKEEEPKATILTNSGSNDEHSDTFIGTQILYGFNITLANVQYLDFERPQYFAISIPTREFNFAGDYSTCQLNEEKVGLLDPQDYTKPILDVNHATLIFNQTLQPSVNYALTCPHAFLTNSSMSKNDRHGEKNIMISFLALSSSPGTNFYNLVSTTFVDFGHNDHDTGTAFATVTMVTLSVLFAFILIYIVLDNKRKANALKEKADKEGDGAVEGGVSHAEDKLAGKYEQLQEHA